MSETEALTAIEPGGSPEAPRLEKLLTGTIDVILAELEGLTVSELTQLQTLETAAKGRTTLLGAITREINRRELEAASDANAEPAPVDIPSSQDYRHMSASQVDSTKLANAVLTRDGWVCPHPTAAPKEG